MRSDKKNDQITYTRIKRGGGGVGKRKGRKIQRMGGRERRKSIRVIAGSVRGPSEWRADTFLLLTTEVLIFCHYAPLIPYTYRSLES